MSGPLTMTVHQLGLALNFAGGLVDPGDWASVDPETQVTFQQLPARKAIDGEELPAGLYAWLAEYPDEGCTLLDASGAEDAEGAEVER